MRCNALLLVFAMLYLLTSYVLDLCAVLSSTYLGSVRCPVWNGCQLEHTC